MSGKQSQVLGMIKIQIPDMGYWSCSILDRGMCSNKCRSSCSRWSD